MQGKLGLALAAMGIITPDIEMPLSRHERRMQQVVADGELVGQAFVYIDEMHPNDAARVRAAMNRLTEGRPLSDDWREYMHQLLAYVTSPVEEQNAQDAEEHAAA